MLSRPRSVLRDRGQDAHEHRLRRRARADAACTFVESSSSCACIRARPSPRERAAGRVRSRAGTARARSCSAGRRARVEHLERRRAPACRRASTRNISCSAPMRRHAASRTCPLRACARARAGPSRSARMKRARSALELAGGRLVVSRVRLPLSAPGRRGVARRRSAAGVHSSRYFGSIARHVTQSWSPLVAPRVDPVRDALACRASGAMPQALADVLPLALARREVDVTGAQDVEVAARERGHEVERRRDAEVARSNSVALDEAAAGRTCRSSRGRDGTCRGSGTAPRPRGTRRSTRRPPRSRMSSRLAVRADRRHDLVPHVLVELVLHPHLVLGSALLVNQRRPATLSHE